MDPLAWLGRSAITNGSRVPSGTGRGRQAPGEALKYRVMPSGPGADATRFTHSTPIGADPSEGELRHLV